ncbi:MAG: DUF4276 family protein [Thermodesulfobacteriota bacterium]
MAAFCIVGEWDDDINVIIEFVKKILSPKSTFQRRKAGGKGKVIGKFVKWLDGLYDANIKKAFIIIDQDEACIKQLVNNFYKKIAGRKYNFKVIFHIVEKEIQTWLLADEKAISSAVGKGKTIAKVKGNLEDINDAKEKLQKILAENNVVYTPEIAKKIAANANIEIIAQRCPGFQRFRHSVLDC